MNGKNTKTSRPGVALLVVLSIVMVVTVLSIGYLTRSDVELAWGRNMGIKVQMDHLAYSGLEHARGLILNPQDVYTEYWGGAAVQQLVSGSDDYYNVMVTKLGECNYQIASQAYRQIGGDAIGRSNLVAELRLDPCIAIWTGGTLNFSQFTVNGDVYSDADITGSGSINGDAFAAGHVTATNVLGSENGHVLEAPVACPGLSIDDFNSVYYEGTDSYLVEVIDSNVHPSGVFDVDAGNPAGIRFFNGDLELPGNVDIKGMLVVNGDLTVTGTNNRISAVKNFPAVLVQGQLIMEDGAAWEISGFTQVGQQLLFSSGASNVVFEVSGSLVIVNGGISGVDSCSGCSVDFTVKPDKAAIEVWPSAGNPFRWSPAAGAFFKSISRQ